MAKTNFVIIKNTLTQELHKYFKASKAADLKAKKAIGVQLLNNIVNGSPNCSIVPPIKTGHLRGSGSVFVGSTLVGDTQGEYPVGKPNKSFSANDNTITVGFDTPYAAKMHENIGIKYQLGPVSEQSGDVEAFFVRKHLEQDKNELWALYAKIVKKETGA